MQLTYRTDHKFLYSVFGGLVVVLTGVAIDISLLLFQTTQAMLTHQLMGDFIAGLVATLVCLALQLKHEEVHYRVAMDRAAIVAELNHHVRNAVFPLCLAVQRLGDPEANRVAAEAVERINIALKEAAADVFAQKVSYAPGPERKVVKAA
jgi:hypothetical protein